MRSLLLLAIAFAHVAGADPLSSWNSGPAKDAILDFVKQATDVPPEKRVATFDQDGTLWVEQPLYTQVEFAVERVVALAPKHPEWKHKEPFKTILSGDRKALAKFTAQDFEKVVAVTHSGLTVAAFHQIVKDWLRKARHPRYKRAYTELVYLPMLEVLKLLRSKGFKTYIVTGGGQEFVRAFAEAVYGIPPEQVIGSAGKTKYGYDAAGAPQLFKLPELLILDDGPGKAEMINLFIGRQPVVAFGNSTGDRQMLEWSQAGGGRLQMLVHHDDATREYAYGVDSKIGPFPESLAAEARQRGWNVVSMARDWNRVFGW